MITFEDVDTVLKQKSVISISDDYNLRQLRERARNNEIIKKILKKLFPYGFIPQNVDMTDFFVQEVASRVKNNLRDKRLLEMALRQLGYNTSCELYFATIFIDFFKMHYMDRTALEFFCNALFSIDKFDEVFGSTFLSLVGGERCEVKRALHQLGMSVTFNERRTQCHRMTVNGLLHNPKLIGAYYYIPYQFYGYIEHSVLIDPERNMVYDLAQDIAIPLNIWKTYYNNPSFVISGEEFQEINRKVMEEYSFPITMSTIEGVRRELKKTL